MGEPKQQGESSLQRKTFLLTCWQERDSAGGKVGWRFRLETSEPGDRHLYINLQDVISEIKTELRRVG
jgi:hypothetical protein